MNGRYQWDYSKHLLLQKSGEDRARFALQRLAGQEVKRFPLETIKVRLHIERAEVKKAVFELEFVFYL